jgi:hypothetical protein
MNAVRNFYIDKIYASIKAGTIFVVEWHRLNLYNGKELVWFGSRHH